MKYSRSKGFTLIELMIVVVIASIIALIAIPAYSDQVRKSRRTDAKNLLLSVASLQQRFFTNNGTYTTNLTGASGLNMSSASSANDWYTISVTAPTIACPIATCYRLEAVPQNDQTNDSNCRTFTLESNGTRDVTGSDPDGRCW